MQCYSTLIQDDDKSEWECFDGMTRMLMVTSEKMTKVWFVSIKKKYIYELELWDECFIGLGMSKGTNELILWWWCVVFFIGLMIGCCCCCCCCCALVRSCWHRSEPPPPPPSTPTLVSTGADKLLSSRPLFRDWWCIRCGILSFFQSNRRFTSSQQSITFEEIIR